MAITPIFYEFELHLINASPIKRSISVSHLLLKNIGTFVKENVSQSFLQRRLKHMSTRAFCNANSMKIDLNVDKINISLDYGAIV